MRTAQPADDFVTSPELAAEIVEYHTMIADLPAGARVLEPSAGDGAFVRAILTANPALQVTAIEPDPTRARMLDGDPRVTVIEATIEDFCAAAPRPQLFDAVVMNPPFALEGQPTAWISHVLLAWHLLAPGGRLVAIIPHEFTFRRDEDHDHLRELVTLHGGYRELPDDAFVSSGVSIGTVVILADRRYWESRADTTLANSGGADRCPASPAWAG